MERKQRRGDEWNGVNGGNSNGIWAIGKWQMANGLHNCRLTDHFSQLTANSQQLTAQRNASGSSVICQCQ